MDYRTKPTVAEYMEFIQGDYSAIGIVLSALTLVLGFALYTKSPHNSIRFWGAIIATFSCMVFFAAFDALLYYHTYSSADACWGVPPVMKAPRSLCAYRIVQTTIQNLLGLALFFYIGWQYVLVYYANHATGLYDLMYYALLKQEFHWSGYDYYWLSWTISGWFGLREGWHVIIFVILVIILSVIFLYWTYRRKYGPA